MDFQFELLFAKSTTITVFQDVNTPSTSFTTTTVSRAKEELGPGWAVDDVYPPLAELRRALLTDKEWAAMSSWEKDVWEMFYRPDWERLACIEQILVDTPAAQRAQRHAEILEALRSLGAWNSVSVDHLDESSVVSIDAALSAIVEEGAEDIHSASTGFITTTATTCSTVCVPRHPAAVPVLVAFSPPIPFDSILNTNAIQVATVPLDVMGEIPAVFTPMDSTPVIQLQQLYNYSGLFRPSASQHVTNKVQLHRPMPWPSLLDVYPTGDDTRPLPWPSFMEDYVCEDPSKTIVQSSQWCCSDSSRAESVAIKFQISDFGGNFLSCTGYIISHGLCNFSEWRCSDALLLIHCRFASDSVQSGHTNHIPVVCLRCTICGFHLLVMVRNLGLQLLSIGPIPEAFVNYAIHDASYWPGYFVSGSQMNLVLAAASRCSNLLVPSVCDSPAVSSLFIVRWYKWVLQQWDSGLQDALHDQFSRATQNASRWFGNFLTVGQLQVTTGCSTGKLFLSGSSPIEMAKFLVWTKEQCGVLLCDFELARVKLIGMFHEFENGWNHMENLHWLKLTWASEQEALISDFQFHWYMVLYLVEGLFFLAAPIIRSRIYVLSLNSTLADWHLHNQSTLTRLVPVCTTELGSTIGDMEAMPSIEALHLLSFSLVVKSLMHSTVACSLKRNIQWVTSSDLEDVAATSALEAHVTLHLSVIEVYRHVLCLGVAYTQEFNADTPGRVVLYKPKVPVIIYLECQVLHRTISLTDTCSLFDADVILVSFCGQTQTLEFLLQGGTRASLVICKLRLQNHQDTMKMKKVGFPRCHALVWRVGKGYQDWQFGHLAIVRVRPVLLPVLAYQLSILTPRMFSFAGGNSDCISLILTAQGICAELLHYRSSEASDYCSMADCGSLVNTLKKHSLSWEPGGKQMTSLDRYIVFQFPWDPGVAAAAWGQAAFQGGRGVRDPSYTSAWAWIGPELEQLSCAWGLLSARMTRPTSIRRKARRKLSRRIKAETALAPCPLRLPLDPHFSSPVLLLLS